MNSWKNPWLYLWEQCHLSHLCMIMLINITWSRLICSFPLMQVYDVSSFVARHPGGMEQIMMGAGRDITQVFESYHPFSIYNMLNKFYVGELVDNEMPVFLKRRWVFIVLISLSISLFSLFSEFYGVLKERVSKYFKDNNIVCHTRPFYTDTSV